MIGAGEADEPAPPRVVAREAHRLHHGLGAGHVERHLVEAGDRADARDVVGDDRVIGAEDGAEIADRLGAAREAILVEVDPEQVHPVGAGKVVEAIAVEVGDGDALGGREERAGAEMAPDVAAELKRHPVAVGELEVGHALPHLRRETSRPREPLPVKAREAHEPGLAARGHLLGGIVRAEDPRLVVVDARDEAGDPARDSDVTGERGVLRPRQREAGAGLSGHREGGGTEGAGGKRRQGGHHGAPFCRSRLTAR